MIDERTTQHNDEMTDICHEKDDDDEEDEDEDEEDDEFMIYNTISLFMLSINNEYFLTYVRLYVSSS